MSICHHKKPQNNRILEPFHGGLIIFFKLKTLMDNNLASKPSNNSFGPQL